MIRLFGLQHFIKPTDKNQRTRRLKLDTAEPYASDQDGRASNSRKTRWRLVPSVDVDTSWSFRLQPLPSDSDGKYPLEDEFQQFINKTLKWARDHGTSKGSKGDEIRSKRDDFAEVLRALSERFLADNPVLPLLRNAVDARAKYNAIRHAVQESHQVVNIKLDAAGLATDIGFNVKAIKLTPEQETLVTDIQRALTVVSVVLGDKFIKAPRRILLSVLRRVFVATSDKSRVSVVPSDKSIETSPALVQPSPLRSSAAIQSERVALRRNDYVRRLADIAREGLRVGGNVRFANSLLHGFQEEFVSREADSVKNRYVGHLGRQALLIGSGFLFPYLVIAFCLYMNWLDNKYVYMYNFLIMALAACAGTWLSFSLRRVVLGFFDLANLEEDRLSPTGRLLFVVGLTWVIGLFLANGIIDIKIGSKTLEKNLGTYVCTPFGCCLWYL